MHIVTQKIIWATQEWLLTNQRAMFWSAEKALILSDLHIGKAAHFRQHGIPIPTQIHDQDLTRLKYLIDYFHAEKLIIVGDLLHAKKNAEVLQFGNFLKGLHPLKTILIKGNHDKLNIQAALDLGIQEIHSQWLCRGLRFIHEWQSESALPQLCGHIHPGYEISFPTRKSLRFPAYVVHKNYLILPAFSQFTGLDTQSKFPEAKFYPFHQDGFIIL